MYVYMYVVLWHLRVHAVMSDPSLVYTWEQERILNGQLELGRVTPIEAHNLGKIIKLAVLK